MPRPFISVTFCLSLLVPMLAGATAPEPLTQDDWPWWRGPTRNGIARDDQQPPTEWSETKNVLWKAPVPGRGHGSPTVVGEHVYLATAEDDEQLQSVLCFDRRSGKQLWKKVVHRGDRTKKGNAKASRASSTPACDGERVYVNFLNNNAVYTTALSRDGKQLWRTKITDYTVHQGYGSSPAIFGSLVIVSADNKGGGAIAALDRETGDVVWKHARPKTPNYASPVILKVDGRDQLLFTGCNLVSSYNPADGKKLWEIAGATTECVTSIVTDGELVFTSGGYPKNHVSAVRGDGSGEVAWENKTRVYVPSMLVKDSHIYATLDAGIAACWVARTGKQLWQHRLGGTFTSSPILVEKNIYATNEDGTTFIFKADPEGFQSVGENHLGDEVFATPAICGGRLYIRVAERKNGERREMLYCLGRTRE